MLTVAQDPAVMFLSKVLGLCHRHMASCSASAEGAAPAQVYEREWLLLPLCNHLHLPACQE